MDIPYFEDRPPKYEESERTYLAEKNSSSSLSRAAEYTALTHPLVLAARAFEKDGKIVLAVLTEPIYLSSERTELKTLLSEEAERETGCEVALTFDLDIYRRISSDMSEETISLIFKKLKL